MSEVRSRPTPLQKTIIPCKSNTYKGFLFRVHRKVHSFWGSLKSSRLTYPCYKISEELGKVKGNVFKYIIETEVHKFLYD